VQRVRPVIADPDEANGSLDPDREQSGEEWEDPDGGADTAPALNAR
jgi:hypothetical protein